MNLDWSFLDENEENMNIDPFEFTCDSCGKTQLFTEQKIEKLKVKTPGTQGNYHILCDFCKKGHMQPPVYIMSDGVFL